VARRLYDGCHDIDEAIEETCRGKSREEDGEVVVVDLELGATVEIGRVDPLTTAEVPVAGVAAGILSHLYDMFQSWM
jgi:hypothetical protein